MNFDSIEHSGFFFNSKELEANILIQMQHALLQDAVLLHAAEPVPIGVGVQYQSLAHDLKHNSGLHPFQQILLKNFRFHECIIIVPNATAPFLLLSSH